MAQLKIVSRWNPSIVLYEGEADTLKDLIGTAIKSGAYLTGADLRGADLTGADLTGAYLTGAYLTGADLTGAYLTGAYLTGAYLSGADLRGAYLTGAYLRGAYLRGADLRGAYLRGAYLRGADLRGAYLTGAYLRGAYLTGAYLRGAYLRGADLTGAYLRGFKVKQANVLTGLYEYVVIPFVTEDNEQRIVMGCHNRSLAEWESDEWNNLSEFPNDGSAKSRARHFALGVAKQWLLEFATEGVAITPDGIRAVEESTARTVAMIEGAGK
jgi:hypothetical protein